MNMQTESCRTIGGLGVLVQARGCALPSLEDPAYRDFIHPRPSSPVSLPVGEAGARAEEPFVTCRDGGKLSRDVPCVPPDIRMEVTPAPAVPAAAGRLLFDNGSWRMYDDGEHTYRIELEWGSPSGRGVTARFDRSTRNVEILCSLDAGAAYRPRIPHDPTLYPLDQLLVMNHLACRGGIITHSAGLAAGDVGVVFAGVSKAGKSTLSSLIRRNAPAFDMLSDDRIIVRRHEGRFRAHGTPWPGEAGIARNASVDLRGFFFLSKADRHRITSLGPSQAVRRLFPVVSCPWYDRERFPGVLDTCEKLVNEVPCFELQFRPDPAVVDLIADFVAGELT